MSPLEEVSHRYYELLQKQTFDEALLDYSVFEKHKPFLHQLALVGNSGVTVFDMFRKEHIFTSYNFSNLFGFSTVEEHTLDTAYFNSRTHPDDLVALMRNGVVLLDFFYQLPNNQRNDYKIINEYRILNGDGKYVRVVEQHQCLELAYNGNLWLSLGIIDLSPDQESFEGLKSQLINFRTGKTVSLADMYANADRPDIELSKREVEVLRYVKDGLLSKEISERLSISVHTVNTHRQRILEKLSVNNSLEAVQSAIRYGLLR